MSEEPEAAGTTRRLSAIEREVPPDGAPLDQSASASAYDSHAGGGPVRRFWSARRAPAAVVALLCAAGAGLLLYDLLAVRLADRPAMSWRRRLADELATRPLDDFWVIAGATAAALIGLWLLLLALTPGLRSLLPMRRPDGDVRAGIDTHAAALVLRDRAVRVPGVQDVRVTVGRRRVRVRARAHFRDLDDVRADADAALADGLRELGLARRPGLSVRVRRAVKK